MNVLLRMMAKHSFFRNSKLDISSVYIPPLHTLVSMHSLDRVQKMNMS
jgi:hypothetical protein